jgi:hypothetical protein
MERVISVPNVKVKDLGGLYIDLRKREFAVKNVGMDGRGTYIYLDEGEEKDPTGVVQEWVDKPVPPATRKEVRRRKEELDKIPAPQGSLRAEIVSGNPGGAGIISTTEQPAVESNLISGPAPTGDGQEQPSASKVGFWTWLKKKTFG